MLLPPTLKDYSSNYIKNLINNKLEVKHYSIIYNTYITDIYDIVLKAIDDIESDVLEYVDINNISYFNLIELDINNKIILSNIVIEYLTVFLIESYITGIVIDTPSLIVIEKNLYDDFYYLWLKHIKPDNTAVDENFSSIFSKHFQDFYSEIHIEKLANEIKNILKDNYISIKKFYYIIPVNIFVDLNDISKDKLCSFRIGYLN